MIFSQSKEYLFIVVENFIVDNSILGQYNNT